MAKYRPVFIEIWVCDEKFQDYTVEGKLLFMYLITNSHLNESGIYRITYKTISNETGIPKDTVIELIKESLNNNITYDENKNVIFVHKFLKYNGSGNPELIKKSIIRDRNLIKTTLWKAFDKYYTSDLKYIENNSENHSSIPIPISNSISNKEYPLEFRLFWNYYPKQKGKKVALTAWSEHPKKNYKELIIASKNYKALCDSNKTEAEFIKDPSGFIRLSKEYWKDYLKESKDKAVGFSEMQHKGLGK